MTTTTTTMTITNEDTGIDFTVRLVLDGDHYGRDDCIQFAADDIGDMLVEFYDRRYMDPTFGTHGQFVSRYYFSTLAGHHGGLILDGGITALVPGPRALPWQALGPRP